MRHDITCSVNSLPDIHVQLRRPPLFLLSFCALIGGLPVRWFAQKGWRLCNYRSDVFCDTRGYPGGEKLSTSTHIGPSRIGGYKSPRGCSRFVLGRQYLQIVVFSTKWLARAQRWQWCVRSAIPTGENWQGIEDGASNSPQSRWSSATTRCACVLFFNFLFYLRYSYVFFFTLRWSVCFCCCACCLFLY